MEVSDDATKGFTDLRESIISRTRALSLNTGAAAAAPLKDGDDDPTTPTRSTDPSSAETPKADSSNVLSRLRSEAAKRLRDLQKAEDAADEALLKFGGNVRDFLKDAISVAPPENSAQGSTVLFESKDASGKRAFHASRFDAQLHVIHTSSESLNKDPSGEEYEKWVEEFDVDKRTSDISTDLAKYPDLRASMEKLVPDHIAYKDFWQRYYFLRHGIETAENRRRELLNGTEPQDTNPFCSKLDSILTMTSIAAATEDDVAWDDDSEDEAVQENSKKEAEAEAAEASAASSTTIQPTEKVQLKLAETRKSHDEKSQADSEASYDVVGAVSGKTSQAPNSPKEGKKEDDSDDDWE